MSTLVFIGLMVVLIGILSLLGVLLQRLKGLEQQLTQLREQLPAAFEEEQPADQAKTAAQPEQASFARPGEHAEPEPESIPEEKPSAVYQAAETSESDLESPGFLGRVRAAIARRFPDPERFIGENLINKVGIAILVLGIGFFVQLAISRGWIGEISRVAIGLLSGSILLYTGHRLRKQFQAFSSVLVGGGIAVWYLTITIAFQEYQLFSQSLAFGITTLITAFTVGLSVLYNRVELAVLGLLGGFTAPFLVSAEGGSYITLFTYLLILNGGMLTLAYLKQWRLVNILAYVGTVVLFGSWLVNQFLDQAVPPYLGMLIYATLFYGIFVAMVLVDYLKLRQQLARIEFTILLTNNAFFFLAGLAILDNLVNGELQGLFTILLTMINGGLAYYFYQRPEADARLRYLLIGLTVTFLSLIAPVQLQGKAVTMFWAAEGVLLLWFAQQTGIRLTERGAVVVSGLAVASLISDWTLAYTDLDGQALTPLANQVFITGLVVVASLGSSFYLLQKASKAQDDELRPFLRKMPYIFGTVLILISYAVGMLELQYQTAMADVFEATRTVAFGLYNCLFATGLYGALRSYQRNDLLGIAQGLLGLLVLAYPFYYNEAVITLRDAVFQDSQPLGAFLFHLAIYGFPFAFLGLIYRDFRAKSMVSNPFLNVFTWIACTLGVVLLSQELNHWVVIGLRDGAFSQATLLENAIRIGYPILWGLTSFGLMWAGMAFALKHLRLISLSLFAVTLLKLFVYDIQDVPEAGKIAAFISLGILLLVVSFMYQRLKQLVLEANNPGKGDQRNDLDQV